MNIRHLILAAATGKKVWTDPTDITAAVFTLPAGAVDGQMDTVVKANMDGTVGTGAVTITSCGKNLFDKTNGWEYGFVNGSSFILESSVVYKRTKRIRCKSNQAYVIFGGDRSVWRFEDINQSFISGANAATATAPSNAAYMIIYYSCAGTHDDSVQLELGTTATAYEPYKYSKATLPAVGSRLPNGVYDEINNGVKAQRVQEYALQAGDIEGKNSTNTTSACFYTKAISDAAAFATGGRVIISGYSDDLTNTIDDVPVGYFKANNANQRIYIGLPLDTTLAAAKAALAGTKIWYQLATPITTPLANIYETNGIADSVLRAWKKRHCQRGVRGRAADYQL